MDSAESAASTTSIQLARIDVKLDQLLSRDVDHETRIRALEQRAEPPTFADHESRLRKLERAVWLIAGAAAAVGGLIGSIVGPMVGVGA